MSLLKNIDKRFPSISTGIFIIVIMMLGTFLRIQYLQKSDFVLNDGGMFFTMIRDLQNNRYVLPIFTTYNFSQIPFAYPPLSFYSGAILNQFFNIDLITIFRVYPFFFNLLSIPAFYFLSKEITGVDRQALLATTFYAILLPGFEWLISGGGLTRSPAHTFFIISLSLYLVYLRTNKRMFFLLSIVSAVIMTLFHIEYCWLLVFSSLLFSANSMSWRVYLKTNMSYLIGIGFLTAPYWVTVVYNHGFSPFISAFSAGEFNLMNSIGRFILLVFTNEPISNYINVLGIIGLFYCVFTKRFSVVIWFLLIALLNSRSVNRTSIFPVTIFAAMTIDKVLCPVFEQIYHRSTNTLTETGHNQKRKNPNFASIFFAFSIVYPFFLGYINSFSYNPVLSGISVNEREAMEWIKSNTSTDSKFVVMDPSIAWHIDQLGEWFPTLAEREGITTVQGSEWLPNSSFETKKQIYNEFKDCVYSGEQCLTLWAERNHINFSYLYISKGECLINSANCLNYFDSSVRASQNYQMIFENNGAVVYQKTN